MKQRKNQVQGYMPSKEYADGSRDIAIALEDGNILTVRAFSQMQALAIARGDAPSLDSTK